MNEFYTELKSLRESQSIELEEIQNRTKINLEYLEAIENGQFSVLPLTYMRLFLKAYCLEIGADPEEALTNLELFLGLESTEEESPTDQEAEPESPSIEKLNLSSQRTPKLIRTDLIKGTVLVVVAIFAIYIIRVINSESAPVTLSEDYGSEFLEEGAVTEVDLTNNFDLLTNNIEKFEARPPLNIKVTASQRLWYKVLPDSTNSIEDVLAAGDNRLHGFHASIDFLFNHTNGVNLYLNGKPVKNVNSSDYPVRVTFLAEPGTVSIKRYTPKN
ncbi:MAG: helix-turn-helix domain-containing protein [Fidelibacterota bacterium]